MPISRVEKIVASRNYQTFLLEIEKANLEGFIVDSKNIKSRKFGNFYQAIVYKDENQDEKVNQDETEKQDQNKDENQDEKLGDVGNDLPAGEDSDLAKTAVKRGRKPKETN